MINANLHSNLFLLTTEFSVTPSRLIMISILGIAFLLYLIMHLKIHSFISLLVAAIAIGIGVGMPPDMIIQSINIGVSTTLQGIALLVGIGSMFGAILEITGGAETITNKILKVFGEKKAIWALGIAGLIVGIPVFFDAALLIIIPLSFGLARKTKSSTLVYGIPLLAGLLVAHSFLPPTPGPIIVATNLGVDLGYVILIGLLCASITMVCGGPLYGKYITKKIHAPLPDSYAKEENKSDRQPPSFGLVISIILIPLVLILLNTVSNALVGQDGYEWIAPARPILAFIGAPAISLLIVTLFSMWALGTRNRFTREELGNVMSKSLLPVGMILLVTAGGGVLRFIFEDSGLGVLISTFVVDNNLPIMLVAFLIAGAIRISLGSATVAMMMASGILATMPIIGTFNQFQLACITLAVAGGASICSHFNDSGFWLVKSLFHLTEKETLKTWTVMTTICGTLGFMIAWIVFLFV